MVILLARLRQQCPINPGAKLTMESDLDCWKSSGDALRQPEFMNVTNDILHISGEFCFSQQCYIILERTFLYFHLQRFFTPICVFPLCIRF